MELQGYLLIDSNKLKNVGEQAFIDHKEQLAITKAKLETEIEISNDKIKTIETENNSLTDRINTLNNKVLNGTATTEEKEELTEKRELKSSNTSRISIIKTETTAKQSKITNIDKLLTESSSIQIKLDKHKLFVEGKILTTEPQYDENGQEIITNNNKYIVSLTGRCIIKSLVPIIDEDGEETKQEYDRYQLINRVIKMTLNANLDIIEHDSFELIAYEIDELITIPSNSFVGSSIVNILEMNDYKYEDIKTVIDTGLAEIKKVQLPDLNWDKMFQRNGDDYADVYLNADFSKITDGLIQEETIQQTTGITETKQVWKGTYPLDRLIYAIQSNLDILTANRKINGDAYGNLYATLMVQAIQSATVLEQARIQAYEQASQFQIKSMIEYYLGAISAKLNVVKTLAEVSTTFLNKAVLQAQIKLYNIQMNGFKANNIYKLFNTQYEGASTAYTSGMLDTPPAIMNNPDMLSLYSNVGSDMHIL